jgi:oxygen-independent coproporphyrinogen-3 oxidase
VDTIYFGGGTPSILKPSRIARLIDAVCQSYRVSADAEITLEVNPGTVSRQDLAAYGRAGVNRLNIGLQSLDDRNLAFLGRIHTAEQGLRTYQHARDAGFYNVGLDLIYALPGQEISHWQAEMASVVQLRPDHLSCYTLTVEPGTPLALQVQAGDIQPSDEKKTGGLFETTISFLSAHGYSQYEISNFARHTGDTGPDRRSRHNRKYWNFTDYFGFGPSSHSFSDNIRWWNRRSLNDYLAALACGTSPEAGREELTPEQQLMEAVYLGLRQNDGIEPAAIFSLCNLDFMDRFAEPLAKLVDEGLVEQSSGRVRLTRRGMRFLDSVAGRLLA